MYSIIRLGSYAAGAILTCAMLAGCGSGGSSSFGPSGLAVHDAALTMPHFAQPMVHTDRGQSWMRPDAAQKAALLYVGDWSTNDVYVYDYKSGVQMGTVTGFDEPYGMCVDAKGDIYVANFAAGSVTEYAHGGTTSINTYNPGGEPMGCAVDKRGDVAVTSFNSGAVTVYAKGDPSKGKTYSASPACSYLWTMGYDDKDNLVGVGEDSKIVFCALLAGSKKIIQLLTSGITVDFPGGTMWDGKYFAIADQESGGHDATGIIQATLKGKTLTAVGDTPLSDNCYSDYVDDVNPFIVGKKNTPVNDKQGTVNVGPNLWCLDAGSGKVDYWKYPAGGLPYTYLGSPPAEPYGAGVSLFAK